MATITALTTQQRNKTRLNVFLDGEFAFGLALNAALGLKIGQELSASEIDALQREDAFEAAKERAVTQLARRPRSTAEIQRMLRRHHVDEETIARVIAYLGDMNYVDDTAFAEYWVDQRESFRPRSRLALRQELAQKGLPSEVIAEAVASVDETDAARRLAEKQARRWRHVTESEFKQKVAGYLQRHGFPFGVIEPLVAELWQSVDTNTDIID